MARIAAPDGRLYNTGIRQWFTRMKDLRMDTGDGPGREKNGMFDRAGAWLKAWFAGLKERSPALSTAIAAGHEFSRDNLKLPAVYFAYNTFLAIFPVLLLVSSVLGFVLAGNQELYTRIINEILRHFPGSGQELKGMVNSVIDNRALVGIIGFIGLLWAGTRIPVGLEAGFNVIWKEKKRPFFKQRLLALWVLFVLGVLGALSIAANLFTSSLLSWTTRHLGGYLIAPVFLLGVFLSLASNFLMYCVIFRIIPRRRLKARAIAIGAAVAAVLFWMSEYVFNRYFVSISKVQALYGTIGAVLGLLLWLHLIGYIVFFSAEIASLHE